MTVKTNNVQNGGGWFSNKNNNITIDDILKRRNLAFPEINEITPYKNGTFLRKDDTDLKRDIIIADTFSQCAEKYEQSGEYLFDNSCQNDVKKFPVANRLINYDDFYIRWWFALYSEDNVLDEDEYEDFRNAIIWKVKSFPNYNEMCEKYLGDHSAYCDGIGIAKIYEYKTIKDLTTTKYSSLLAKKRARSRRGGKKSRKSRNKKRKSNKKKRKTVKKRRLRKQK